MIIAVTHIALATLLFFAVNWIGEKSSTLGYLQLSLIAKRDPAPAFNFIFKTLAPTAYIILVATGFYILNRPQVVNHIWLVVVYYFAGRLLYSVALGRAPLLNWISTLAQIMVGITVARIAYLRLILPRHPLFPSVESIGNQLWVIIALFLYAAFNNLQPSTAKTVQRKNRYLRSRFKDIEKQYGRLIEGQFPEKYMELVAYSVFIYETFNRPWIAQLIERIIFPWGSQTLGPMQVRTATRISNLESVVLGMRHLREAFEKTNGELIGTVSSRYTIIRLALAKYNRDESYIQETIDLLHILWAQIATDYRTEFETMYNQGLVVNPISLPAK